MTFVRAFTGLGIVPDDWTDSETGFLSHRYINRVAWPDGHLSGVQELLGLAGNSRRDIEQCAATGLFGFVADECAGRPGTFTAWTTQAAGRLAFAGLGAPPFTESAESSFTAPGSINKVLMLDGSIIPIADFLARTDVSPALRTAARAAEIQDRIASGVVGFIAQQLSDGLNLQYNPSRASLSVPGIHIIGGTGQADGTVKEFDWTVGQPGPVPEGLVPLLTPYAGPTSSPANAAGAAGSAVPPATHQTSTPPPATHQTSTPPPTSETYTGPVPIELVFGDSFPVDGAGFDDGSNIADQAGVVGTAPMNPWLIGAAALGALFIFGGSKGKPRRGRR
jgi:hypothetical protein